MNRHSGKGKTMNESFITFINEAVPHPHSRAIKQIHKIYNKLNKTWPKSPLLMIIINNEPYSFKMWYDNIFIVYNII